MRKTISFVVMMLIVSTSHAEFLYERAGGLAYYDWHQDITWMQDASYALTSGYDPDGLLRFDQALFYMDYLNAVEHMGISTWRLPKLNYMTNNGAGSFSYCGSDTGHNIDPEVGELAFMYYEHLKLNSKFDCLGQAQTPHGVTYSGPFININNNETEAYIYGDEYAPEPTRVWGIHFEYGGQHADGKASAGAVWPVFSGDLLYMPGDPLPTAVILDVLPWSVANEIDPASERLIHIAMMGSAAFDAAEIDLGTVRFGPSKAMSAGATFVVSDQNGDSYDDMGVLFATQDTGIVCDDTDVSVYGESYTGETFTGIDQIATIECDTGGCHP
jgi:hypothetical protein